jgi:Protein of unknown function (DUF3320)
VLKEQLTQVIDQEGPLSEAVLFRKIARAWGLERTGSRIVERLKILMPTTVLKTKDGLNIFYWPQGARPESFSLFRIADDAVTSKRHIDEVCTEEVSALVLHVLRQAGGTTRQDIARTVCRLVGMSAATSAAIFRVTQAVDRLKAGSHVVETGDPLRLGIPELALNKASP